MAVVVLLLAVTTAAAFSYYEVYHHSQRVSWEIASFCRADEDGPSCIFRWLQQHRATIRHVAQMRHITPLAIGGVIAFESLEDVDPSEVAPFSRYSGPGKVHYKNWRFWEGEPVAKAVEDRGYLPKQTMSRRRVLLATADGAIIYIGSILQAYADVAARRGYNIRCSPALLSTFYSAWDFAAEAQLLEKRPRSLRQNDIGKWVSVERRYLENAIGDASPECSPRSDRVLDEHDGLTVRIRRGALARRLTRGSNSFEANALSEKRRDSNVAAAIRTAGQ